MEPSVVLITGSAKGIGKEVGRQLAEAGMTVILSARDRERAAEAAASLSEAGDVRALAVDLDVADQSSVDGLAEAVRAAAGGLDVLVNNAAAYVDWEEMASKAELAAAEAVLAVNLFGAWRVTQALLPLLRESNSPRVVNVSSGAGSHGDESFGLGARGGAATSYGVSKAALNALTSSLAAELAGTDVLVNSVCPGLTATWPGAEQMGARPLPDGAASVAWAVTLPDDGPSGGFFRDGEPLPW